MSRLAKIGHLRYYLLANFFLEKCKDSRIFVKFGKKVKSLAEADVNASLGVIVEWGKNWPIDTPLSKHGIFSYFDSLGTFLKFISVT